MSSSRTPLSSAFAPVRALFVSDAAGGILLIAVAALAIFAANSAFSGAYHGLLHDTLPWSPVPKLDTLHLWINDGLMAIFFFVVGLEVKREIIAGELATAAKRRLPILAAIAGMAVPAAIYLFVAQGSPELTRGWAIPAATDIAFAVGVLGLLGSRVPASLRLFLLTVAIVDDLGAVAIIAFFYTTAIKLGWLLAGLLLLGLLIGLNRFRVTRALPYIVLSVALWVAVLHSGVHATIAGVAAAFTIPMRGDLLVRMEHSLASWSAYAVVPIFGFANAGVSLAGMGLQNIFAPLPLAVACGLAIGKQVGILGSIALARALGIASPPEGAGWAQIWGVATLCGIGFTMSLFIGALAFPNHPLLIEEAKIGVLGGSLVSAVLGYAILRFSHPPAQA